MDLPAYIRTLAPDDIPLAIERAAILFEASPRAVKGWYYGERKPRPVDGQRIVERTRGKVTFSSLYGIAK